MVDLLQIKTGEQSMIPRLSILFIMICIFTLSGCSNRIDPIQCNEEQREEVSRITEWCVSGMNHISFCFDKAVERVCKPT